ncbi:hypothetical protein [Streptomyces sp. CAU 1734]|uniref:hypothetical protein n=1 Tax=Streptomyces sp. CAU 1734 TaxID=3140360 RepID=UPI00325FFA3C
MELTTFGALLRDRDMGYAAFCRSFTAAARELGLTTAPPQRRQFDRWRVTGRMRTRPRDDSAQILEKMTGIQARALFRPAIRPHSAGANAQTALEVPSGLLSPESTALMAATRARLDAAIEGAPFSIETLTRWEEIAHDYARAYQALPPQSLLADLIADLGEVQQLLDQTLPIRYRRRLCRVIAQLAALAGIFTSACGAHREARQWFHTGGLAAAEAGDLQLEGMLAVRAAVVSLYYGTPVTAYRQAARARTNLLRSAPGPATVRGLLVEARALARLDRPAEALPLLRQAEDGFSHLTAEDRTDLCLGYTQRQFHFHLGNAYTHLGRTAEAWAVQQQALAAYAPTERLDPTLIRIDRAVCLARAGEPEEAYRVAGDAISSLPAEHRTGMVIRYAGDFAAVAGRPELPAGRDFAELLA